MIHWGLTYWLAVLDAFMSSRREALSRMHCRRKVGKLLGDFLFLPLVAEAFLLIEAVVKNLCVSEKIALKVEVSQVWANPRLCVDL